MLLHFSYAYEIPSYMHTLIPYEGMYMHMYNSIIKDNILIDACASEEQ